MVNNIVMVHKSKLTKINLEHLLNLWFHIAAALHLGAPICTHMNSRLPSGVHDLSCRQSSDRHVHHSAVNEFVKHALLSAKILW